MLDGVFFINSAIDASHSNLSVFNTQERFEQTLETLKSIDNHCPNNAKFIFDMSPEEIDVGIQRSIAEMPNTWFIDMGKHEYVKMFSMNGLRSVAETFAFRGFIDWFKQQNIQAKRIYKLSGRYTLNDNFVLNDESYADAFVFAEALDTWMPEVIVPKLYRLRLWHMDYNLLEKFEQLLPEIFNDCSNLGVDIEHSYYRNLHDKFKIVELSKIGVSGVIAPSGEVIDE